MTANPFQVASQVAGAFGEQRERNALDDILQKSMSSNDPNQQTDLIRQIISRLPPEKRQEGFQFIQQKQQQLAGQKQAQAYREAGLNPNLPESINKEIAKRQTGENEKKRAYTSSMDLVNRAREIAKTGNLGPVIGFLGTGRNWGSTVNPFGSSGVEGRKLRAEYKQIGKALVQAAAPLKITNRTEFEHYAKDLENPKRTVEEIEGSLSALERIIRNSAGIEQEFVDQKAQATMETPKQASKPPLDSFYR